VEKRRAELGVYLTHNERKCRHAEMGIQNNIDEAQPHIDRYSERQGEKEKSLLEIAS